MIKSALLLILFLGACNSVAFAQGQPESELNKAIDKQVYQLMHKGNVPGLSLILIRDGRQEIRNYGYADLDKRNAVTAHTLFQLGSCTKAFTALAILKLVKEGKIRMDAPISTYLPWFKVTYEDSTVGITVRQLLHHTSGIRWQTISSIPAMEGSHALEYTIRQINGARLHNLPGSKYEYATINYDILALIAQTVTGRPFESYLQENILDALHLSSTTVGRPLDSTVMATGYKIGFFRPRAYAAPVFQGNYAAGYVISNAADVAEWLKFQMGLGDSALFDLAAISHQRDETVPLHGMSSYAMGWEASLSGNREISHSGMNPNFTSFIAFRPEKKLGIAILANSNSNYTPDIGEHIMKLLAGDKIENEYDPGNGSDTAFSMVSFMMGAYVLIAFAFWIRILAQVITGKRKKELPPSSRIRKFLLSLLLPVPFLFALYLLPRAIAGFTWQSISVWMPVSFVVMTGLILSAATISYLAYFTGLLFPEKDPYKRVAPGILVMSIVSGLCNMVVIILVTSGLDKSMDLKYLLFYYVLAMSVYLLGRRYVQVNLIRFTRGLIYELRIRLIGKIFSTSYQRFEKIDRGRIYTALNDDVDTIGNSSNMVVNLISSLITAVGAFLYLATIDGWVTLVTTFLLIGLSALYYFVSQRTRKYYDEARNTRNVFMRLVNGMIDGFKEISLHRNRKSAYKDDVAGIANEYRVKASTADIMFTDAFLIGESFLLVLLGVVSFAIPKLFPDITTSTIMSFVIVLLYLIGPINAILNSVPSVMQIRIAWERVRQFLKDIPASLDHKSTARPFEPEVHSIRATGITYAYPAPNQEESFIVGPIDLEVKRGEILFIIGGNGSGKTTLAKLLTGLYEPDTGKILVNEKMIDSALLGEYFSTVFSPPHLFQKLYDIETKDRQEEVQKYLKLLHLQDKLSITENEYSTIDLSGGQRKRLALLQCFLEDSPIYLFDEWAADQDPEYRNFFYRILLPEMRRAGKLIIAITHDDHYFDVADKVMKMNQGKLEMFVDGFLFAEAHP